MYKILSTKALEPSLVEQAKQNNIEIIEQKFISVKPIWSQKTLDTILEIAKERTIYIALTSGNAVHVLNNYLRVYDGYFFDWKIFCLSGKTRQVMQAAKFLDKNIIGEAKDASKLAKKIIESGVDEIIFFCGNKRRDELPVMLKNANIKVHEVVLYETLEIAIKVNVNFDAILFFSPSGVQSFFSVNKLAGNTICFAIGAITATSIAAFSNNEIVSCSTPNPEAMIEQVIQRFKEKSAIN